MNQEQALEDLRRDVAPVEEALVVHALDQARGLRRGQFVEQLAQTVVERPEQPGAAGLADPVVCAVERPLDPVRSCLF